MRFLLLLILLLPAACGDLPQPYRGRPGGDGARLAMPLALRVAVPPPTQALLTDDHGRVLAEALASALRSQDIPATATERPMPLDWQVDIRAESGPSGVMAYFRLLNADGQEQGVVPGVPVSPAIWTNPTPEALNLLANHAARGMAGLLLQVDAARKQMDPVALAGGPARIRFLRVSGAPGDGNTALAARMRDFLSRYGYVLQDASEGATFGLEGRVLMVPIPGNKQRVEISWRVSRRDGEELGQVVQMNEVQAGSLNRPWGDVAYVVAEEAAGAIRTVLVNATNSAPTATPPAAEPAAPRAASPPLPRNLPQRPGNPLAAPPAR